MTRGERRRGSPSWSPDGHQIAFDSFDDESHYHIWIMDADGAHQRQVTADPGDQNIPTWSGDGRWIYFSWGQGNERDIWRMPAGGGPKQRVTRGGAVQEAGVRRWSKPRVSTIFRQWAVAGGSLEWRIPASTRPVRDSDAFDVATTGIYYVPCSPYATAAQLHVMDPDTGSRSTSRHTGKVFSRQPDPHGVSRRTDSPVRPRHRSLRSHADRELPVTRRILPNRKGPRQGTPASVFSSTWRTANGHSTPPPTRSCPSPRWRAPSWPIYAVRRSCRPSRRY